MDNLDGMKQMIKDGIQVDSIVTDPPYNLSFMGKPWDSVGTPKEFQEWNQKWAELAYQILKPGGYLVVFGGTRTYHRMVSGVEDARFEICDTLEWIYGVGMPKSYNISKGFDKQAGAERKIVAENKNSRLNKPDNDVYEAGIRGKQTYITEPATDLAKQWDGWGTSLKPAHEPILLAQKPREGTYCDNIEKYGCGGINIDECRVDTTYNNEGRNIRNEDEGENTVQNCPPKRKGMKTRTDPNNKGRFPANLLLTHHPDCECIGEKKVKGAKQRDEREDVDDKALYRNSRKSGLGGYADKDGLETVGNWNCVEGCPIRIMNEQSGVSISKKADRGKGIDGRTFKNPHGNKSGIRGHNDKGGASRYFNNFKWQDEDFFLYTVKASKSERTCDGNVENKHPTVKPLELIRWLVKLSTPKDGVSVDLFCGSGTHPCSAYLEGINFIAFEKEKEYWKIANNRYEYYKNKPIQESLF